MGKLDVSFRMQPPFVAYKRDVSLRNMMVRSTDDAFPRMSAASIEQLQLHQFCRWYAALSLFSISDHSYFFTLVKLSFSSLSDSQGEMYAKCSRGGKKEKGIAALAILQRAD